VEENIFEVGLNFNLIWDTDGLPIIIDNEKVILTSQNCMLKTFKIKQGSSIEKSATGFEMMNGHRFDAFNHNYFLHIDHLSLGFSYMAFVINQRLTEKDPLALSNMFDPEPYNYIFNKTTGIIDGIHYDGEFPIKRIF